MRHSFVKASSALAVLLSLGMAGCSGMIPEGLMPTKEIKSSDTTAAYPNINAPLPTPEKTDLTTDEREEMFKQLDAARAKNEKAAATPLTQQVP